MNKGYLMHMLPPATIFGLILASLNVTLAQAKIQHFITGTIVHFSTAETMSVRTRSGIVNVSYATALAHSQVSPLSTGLAVSVSGTYVGGAFEATSVSRAKPSAQNWLADR